MIREGFLEGGGGGWVLKDKEELGSWVEGSNEERPRKRSWECPFGWPRDPQAKGAASISKWNSSNQGLGLPSCGINLHIPSDNPDFLNMDLQSWAQEAVSLLLLFLQGPQRTLIPSRV